MPVLLLLFLLLFTQPVLAADTATGSASVTATVPQFIFPEPDTPVLISPANQAVLSANAPGFIFNPSWGEVYVNHYQLYLDGNLNTNNIPQSTNTIMTNALTGLNDGQHTWMIKAIGNNGMNRNSATWTFTIDTIAPLLLINQVADQPANLSSLDLASIPGNLSFLTTQTQPKIQGISEANSVVTITFSRFGQTVVISGQTTASGNFILEPKNKLSLGDWSVTVTASDPAGNATSLPVWTLSIKPAPQISLSLPSPLPEIIFNLPFAPQSWPKLPAAMMALPEKLTCTCYPFIWIIIVILILYIFYLHHQNRSKGNNRN